MRAQPASFRAGIRDVLLAGLCAAALAAGAAAPARAERPLISEEAVVLEGIPGGILESPCGVALDEGQIFVSDYYDHAVDVFSAGSTRQYIGRIAGNPLDGSCQLATSADGTLYANNWHESVGRLRPTSLEIDAGRESTGVAVDPESGDVYVDDRTYVAVYEPSGAPVLEGGEPLRIGLGSLGEGYGLAVAAGRVYVPDAADDTVKVYEPSTDPLNPVAVIDGAATPQGRFVSLVDATVAIDPSDEHLLVVDNLQPGFEHPEARIEEFDSSGTFLGQIAQRLIDGEPTGIDFSDGHLFVTNGNSEEGRLFEFGPYQAGPLAIQSSLPQSARQPAIAAQVASSSPLGAGLATPELRLSPGSAGKHESMTIAVRLPSAGILAVSGKGLHPWRRRARAGRRLMRLRLSPGGRHALSRTRLGKLEVRVFVTFMREVGADLSTSETVTFKIDKEGAR